MNLWRRSITGLTGLCEQPEGWGLAHVVRRGDQPPLVTCCRFIARGEGRESLARAIKEAGLRRSAFVGLLHADQYRLFPAAAPAFGLPPDEWPAAMRWRIMDRLDFPVEEAVIELFELPDLGAADQPMIYVAASRETLVRQRADLFHELGLNLTAIDIVPLALARLMALSPSGGEAVGLLYSDAGAWQVMICRGDQFGLARALLTPVWHERGSVFDSRLTGAQLDPLADEVRRTLDYYAHYFQTEPATTLLTAPLVAPLPDWPQGLAERLEASVAELPIHRLLTFAEATPTPVIAHCLPALAAALR